MGPENDKPDALALLIRYLYQNADVEAIARELAALPEGEFSLDAEYVLGAADFDELAGKLTRLNAAVRRLRGEQPRGPAA